jgi:3-oxoacyl-[acyl-carrier protein] reductase
LYIRQRLTNKQPGVIVNVSSIIGIRGYAGLAAYSASKGGLDAMTRALAREMGSKGFRVNSVLPGYFESDLSKSLTEKQKQQIENRTPLGRLATYSDIVPVIRFLALDDSSFMTGQSIVVDGGITV